MRMICCSVALAAMAAAWPGCAFAQDAYDACAAMADDAARLRCFDETHAAQKAQSASRAAEDAARREAEFGLTATQRERRAESEAEQGRAADTAGEAAAEAEEDTVHSVVAEVFSDAARRPVILLENGQVWRGTSNSNFRRRVRAGWEAEITRSWTGGYRMTFEGQSGYLGVARVR